MPNVEVYCTVSNCHYWADANHCAAEKILVTTDEIGEIYPETVDASETRQIVNQHGPTEAHGCVETCCKTFTAKKQPPAGTPKRMGTGTAATGWKQ